MQIRWISIFPILMCCIASTVSAEPSVDERANKTISCYNGGQNTIQKMRDCSGFWVTPRALLLCTIQAGCPVQLDTEEGRANLASTLTMEKLTVDSQLFVRAADLPKLPDPKTMAECQKASTVEDCVSKSLVGTQEPFLKCAKIVSQSEQAECFANLASVTDPNTLVIVKCLGSDTPTADKVISCMKRPDLAAPAQKAMACIANAEGAAEKQLDCLIPNMEKSQRALPDCLAKLGNDRTRVSECVERFSPDVAKAHRTIECFENPQGDLVKCSQDAVGGPSAELMSCFARATTPLARGACAGSISPEGPRAKAIADCVSSGAKDNQLAICLAPFLGGDAAKISKCVTTPGSSLNSCLIALNPKIADADRVLSCVSKVGENVAAFGCAAQNLGGDAPKIAACISNPDRTAAALCLLGNKPEAKIAREVYACVAGPGDAGSLLAHCTKGLIKDEKTRQALSCVALAAGDKGQLAGCAAGSVLPPQAARVLGCATASQSPTSFALCSAGPLMNEEWRIASQCAVQTGGIPAGFAVCAAGRLTIRELTKCFTSGGKDCYGPNNEIVKAVNGIGKTTEKATHDAGKAIEKATDDAG